MHKVTDAYLQEARRLALAGLSDLRQLQAETRARSLDPSNAAARAFYEALLGWIAADIVMAETVLQLIEREQCAASR